VRWIGWAIVLGLAWLALVQAPKQELPVPSPARTAVATASVAAPVRARPVVSRSQEIAVDLDDAFCEAFDAPLPRTALKTLSDRGATPLGSPLRDAEPARDAATIRDALRRAHANAPDDPAIALWYAFAAKSSPEFREAGAALGRYLAQNPDDARIARLRRRLETQAEIQLGFARLNRYGITLDYPREMSRADALAVLRQIDGALVEAADLTGIPLRTELYAVIYQDRSELLAVTCARSWAGGVYDGTLRLVRNETGDVDSALIRHETLHASQRNAPAPAWFKEGVAQYFETRGKSSWRRTFAMMVHNHTYIPFDSLVGTFGVFDESFDARLAYDESLAMIQLLVEREGEEGIARAVALLESGTKRERLAGALGLTEEALLDMLHRRAPKHSLDAQ
jgi:hypothetical protein